MITKDSYDLILRVESFDIAMPETCVSSSEEGERLEYLADSGYLVRHTLTPPTSHSRALIAYHVSPAGKDACEQYAEAERKEQENAAQIKRNDRRSKRHDFFVAVISAVVSALMTLLVEHFDEIVVFFVEQLSE